MQEYEYTPLYYGTPCQVRFYNEGEFYGGIALHDFLICGKTGDILAIKSVIEAAAADGIHWDNAIIELAWQDVSNAILDKNFS